jgi:hypothetical protein
LQQQQRSGMDLDPAQPHYDLGSVAPAAVLSVSCLDQVP